MIKRLSHFIGWNVVVVFFLFEDQIRVMVFNATFNNIAAHMSYKALYYNVLWGCCDRTVVDLQLHMTCMLLKTC